MAFTPQAYSTFSFDQLVWDCDTFHAEFHYSLSGEGVDTTRFVEKLQFTASVTGRIDRERFDSLLVLLGAVAGLSYFKAANPPRIELKVPGFTKAGLNYFRLVLQEGMAEYAYRNDLGGPLNPEIVATEPLAEEWAQDTWRDVGGDPLVPIGGGKDSVVSVEALHKARLHPIQFAVNPNPIIERVARVSGHALISAKRTIDPHLLEINQDGALNGHVPVTAINSLITLAQSRIFGAGPVVMSNEHSASEPTLVSGDWSINHQWSKSLEAELALQAVIGPQAGLSPEHYFSLLRPFSELRIAGVYAMFPRYHQVATSCNRAFRLNVGDQSWCGECDKCRFVYLVLSNYLAPHQLDAIFGRELLNEEEQLAGFEALLGLDQHKPFECVGTEAESMVALSLTARKPAWAHKKVVAQFMSTIPRLTDSHKELEHDVFGVHQSPALLPEAYESARSIFG